MRPKYSVVCCLLACLALINAGCNRNIQPIAFTNNFEPQDTTSASSQSANPINTATEPSVIPASVNLIPMANRDAVFDNLLGKNKKVYFTNNNQSETMVVFDNEQSNPEYITQIRKVGSTKGFLVVLVGLYFNDNIATIKNVFTFEYGNSLPKQEIYTKGKKKYLSQFSGKQTGGKIEVAAVTGATPICKPLTKEIQDIVDNIKSMHNDSSFLAEIKANGRIWDRTEAAITAPLEAENTSPEKTTEIKTNTASAKPQKNNPDVNSINILESETSYESIAVFEEGSESEDFLTKNSEYIGTAELVLISVGIGIIIGSQCTRRKYR